MIINPFVDNSFQLLWPQQVEERCCLLQACVVHIVTSTGSLEVCQSTSFFKTHFKLEYVFFFLQDGGYFSVQSGGQECCCPRQLDPPPPLSPLAGPWRSPKGALFKPHSLSYFPREIHTPGQTAQTDHCVHKGELSIATVHLQCHALFFFFFFSPSPKTPQRELILDSTKTLNCHCSFWSRETSGGVLGMGCVFVLSLAHSWPAAVKDCTFSSGRVHPSKKKKKRETQGRLPGSCPHRLRCMF